MDWMSNLFIALLLTDITGTLFFLIGWIIGKLFFRNDIGFFRFLVITTLCAYTVPFVYIIFYAGVRINALVHGTSYFNLFYNSPTTSRLFSILGIAWIAMFLGLLAYRLYRGRNLIAICRGNIPVEDEKLEQRFMDICAELGIKRKVSLYWNDSIRIPCTTYWHGPVVMLPLVKYTELEANVVFHHELHHYLHKDVLLKSWNILVTLIHGFNPAVHILLKEIDLIAEASCDRVACERGRTKELYNNSQYFSVIRDLLLDDGQKDRYQLFSLVDSKSDYERRVNYMSLYCTNGILKKGTAVVLSACFILGSGITALAAGEELKNAYIDYANSTSETINALTESGADDQALEEFCRAYDLDPDDMVMMGDDGIEPYASSFNISWDVPVGMTYMTSGFTETVGAQVAIAVTADPEDVTYWAGIKDPNQMLRYVEGEGVISHTFDIEVGGRYYFFVSNLSETETLHVDAFVAR